jgi:hypothetical protein
VSLGKGHIGGTGAVHYAPSIPRSKESGARAAHGSGLPDSEPILILYDATLLGGGEDGFLITPERLCWKNAFEHPRQIAWSDIDPASITPARGKVGVAGGLIGVSGELCAGVARLLADLVTRYRIPDTSPYRRSVEEIEVALPGQVPVTRLVALARQKLGEVEHVYYHPSIPAPKLRSSLAMRARDETVAVLYDDTLFGSAAEGFFLTPERVGWKNLVGPPLAARWVEIDPAAVSASGNIVFLGPGAIQITARVDIVAGVAGLLASLAAEARKG